MMPVTSKIRSKLKFILQKLLHPPGEVSARFERLPSKKSYMCHFQMFIRILSLPLRKQQFWKVNRFIISAYLEYVWYLGYLRIPVFWNVCSNFHNQHHSRAAHLQSPRWHCPETRPKFLTIRCNSLRIVEWPIAGHQELSHVATPLIVPIEPTVGVCSIQAQPFQVVQVWGDENSKHGTSSILCYQNNRKMPPRFHTMIRFRS